MQWKRILELDSNRRITGGSEQALAGAIRNAADLRIGTKFRHNEHIDTTSGNAESISEVAEFGITYLIDDRWVAGVMSLRQPVELPDGFGPRSSMSYFLYNQDGLQAIARPFLDGKPAAGTPGPSPAVPPLDMPRYHAGESWDSETNAPSHNYIYDFSVFRFFTCDSWKPVLAHDARGEVTSGSLKDLVDAFTSGRSVKIGISDIFGESASSGAGVLPHELFVEGGSGYYYTDQKLFILGTHPIVRVKPNIPMSYTSRGWDFG